MPHGGASIYRDRLNYAGIHYGEPNIGGGSDTPPTSFVLRDGKLQELGWGSVQHWDGDVFVLSVPVDEGGNPAGDETRASRVGRIVAGGREWIFPEYDFEGRAKDGTLAFVSPRTDPMVVDGLPHEPARAQARVLLWREGRIISHVTLPQDWGIVGYSAEGWMLARSAPPYRQEENWSAGMLRGEEFTPITFPRPKGTEKLLWRDGAYQLGANAFRFHAFFAQTDRWFWVARS